ncbi:centrosomal protein of 290 kDa [Patella vulgata]|uniref:centrosomal protein of 290 kDa n=1 Tax=Patella vulgata TaxID=6465 RepID=UPI00217F715F|nr:centrosomal protein of 290 kDa [Patella vulgata]
MSFPDIHCCSMLTAENLELKKKYNRLKQQKEKIQNHLDVILEQQKVEKLLKNFVTTRNVYVQTETPGWLKSASHRQQPIKTPVTTDRVYQESEQMTKVLSMQNQLMKRYEKEVKQNMEHLETITNLNGKIAQLESKVQKGEEELFSMKRELFKVKGPTGSGASLKDVTREKIKLKKENKKLRTELDGLDKGFFDEVEDIKYALQQSAKLNQEYDKLLRKMCKKYGVPFPKLEKILDVGTGS